MGPPQLFGRTPDDREAFLYTLENERLRVKITDFGCRIVSIEARNRAGVREHVALGFDSLSGYLAAGGSFGAVLGRTANRIACGRFTLDGKVFDLSRNDGENTLHGGADSFGKRLWTVESASSLSLALRLTSPDGDQGFPGTLTARASFQLEENTIELTLEAATTQASPVNLSAHPYFNLGGLAETDVLDHEIVIFADRFLPVDRQQIPTGEIRSVANTPFDFRLPTPIGARIRDADAQLLYGKGYDHCFVLDERGRDAPRPAARVRHRRNGQVLEISTTQPGLQFYTGNSLNGSVAGRGGAYRQSAGFALEPQGFPNAPNQPNFPSVILRPGTDYCETIRYRFDLEP
jgi:aldose 1-epimerase